MLTGIATCWSHERACLESGFARSGADQNGFGKVQHRTRYAAALTYRGTSIPDRDNQRSLLDCANTDAASSFVSEAYFLLASTLAATPSISEPVCLSPLRCESADAANLFATCDAPLSCNVSPASFAIRTAVCFVFFDATAPGRGAAYLDGLLKGTTVLG